jgi:hypothetical protein
MLGQAANITSFFQLRLRFNYMHFFMVLPAREIL